MHLFILTRTDSLDYDETVAMVVRARSEAKARLMAAHDGHPAFLSPETATCKILKPEGKETIIMRDFRAS